MFCREQKSAYIQSHSVGTYHTPPKRCCTKIPSPSCWCRISHLFNANPLFHSLQDAKCPLPLYRTTIPTYPTIVVTKISLTSSQQGISEMVEKEVWIRAKEDYVGQNSHSASDYCFFLRALIPSKEEINAFAAACLFASPTMSDSSLGFCLANTFTGANKDPLNETGSILGPKNIPRQHCAGLRCSKGTCTRVNHGFSWQNELSSNTLHPNNALPLKA